MEPQVQMSRRPRSALPIDVAARILQERNGQHPPHNGASSHGLDVSQVLKGAPKFSRVDWHLRREISCAGSSQLDESLPRRSHHQRLPHLSHNPARPESALSLGHQRQPPRKRLTSAAMARSLPSATRRSGAQRPVASATRRSFVEETIQRLGMTGEWNLSQYGGPGGAHWGHPAADPADLPDWKTKVSDDVVVAERRAGWVKQTKKKLEMKQQAAALVIQKAWRGWIARNYVRWRRKVRTLAVGILQKAYRGHLGRRYVRFYFNVREFAAVRIQSVLRRGIAIRFVQKFVTELLWAIAVIARCYRGYRARKSCLELLHKGRAQKQLRERSACRIQKFVRAMIERRKYTRVKSTLILMQRAVRGRKKRRRERCMSYLRAVLARRAYKVMKRKAHLAARTIQRAWWVHNANQQLGILHRAAMKLQRTLRRRWCLAQTRAQLVHRRLNVVVLQMWWRRHYIWIKAHKKRMKKAAIFIQRNWRKHRWDRLYSKMRKGAIICQNLYRRRRAMTEAMAQKERVGEEIDEMLEKMNESALLAMRIMSWPCWGPPTHELLRVLRHLTRFKAAIRALFLRYSILAVPDFSRPMRLSYFQWRAMMIDAGVFIKDKIKPGVTLEDVYLKTHTEPELNMSKSATLKMYVELSMPDTPSGFDTKDKGKETCHIGQFVESLMYAALAKFGKPGEPGERPEQNASGKLHRLLSTHFDEWEDVTEDRVFGDRRYLTDSTTAPAVQKEIKEWDSKLRKVHKSLASGRDEETGERVVNAVGFIKLVQEIKLIGPGLSFAKALEGFIASNHEELAQYLTYMTGVGHFHDTINLEYPEFEESVLHCIVTKELKNAVSSSMMTIDYSSKKFLARLTEVLHSITLAGPSVAQIMAQK